MTQCCKENIPRKGTKDKGVPWWTDELQKLRTETNNLKKQLYRARKLNFYDLIPEYEQKFRRARNKYAAVIRKTKRSSWKIFDTKEGNRDPWGMIYKIVRHKLNKEEYLNSIKLSSGEALQ